MTTLSDMMNTSEDFFECFEFCFDDLRRLAIQCIERLQAVAGNAEHDDVVRPEAALLDQFLRNADGHTASRLAEHPLRFCEQLAAGDNFRVRRVFRISA